MSLEVVSRQQFARSSGLVGVEGSVAAAGVAGLLREALSRWGLSPRRALLRFAREQLEAAGLTDGADVADVLARLEALGECQAVSVGGTPYVAPGEPRWVPCGSRSGALLSVGPVPGGLTPLPAGRDEVVRRVQVAGDDDLATLHLAEVRRCELEDWARPLHYLRHASRRLGRLVRDDTLPVGSFWELLTASLSEDGRPLGDDAEVRYLSGPPGGFFGRHSAAEPEGRWSVDAGDGVWCAYRRGYSDKHWHPLILAVDAGERRALDLYDHDEWRWAVLARAQATGVAEIAERAGGTVKLNFPPPDQLVVAMDLIGSRSGSWEWALCDDDAPNVWRSLIE